MNYVSNTTKPTKDPLFTDLGIFQIASDGVPADSGPQKLGELWVTYKIKLSRAKIFKSALPGPVPPPPTVER